MKKLLFAIFTLTFFLCACNSSVPADSILADHPQIAKPLNNAIEDVSHDESIPPIPEIPEMAEPEIETTAAVDNKTPEQNSKLVYLTFDDGPGKYTEQVLEILDEYDVTATFFMVGEYIGRRPERVQAVYEAGHLIGCHSTKHAYKEIYQNKDTITADIEEWEKIIS